MKKVNLCLDSGAYTAYRQGEKISLKRYIRFIDRNRDLISSYVNLDCIPGRPGAIPTPKDVEEAAERGWRNLVKMREAGLNPIAVYHMGERRYWLEKMIGEGFDYIGLGGVANAGDAKRRPWVTSVFSYLCDNRPFPCVKVHGFGITSVDMMSDFPWTTVDSVSWMKQGVTGACYIPVSDRDGFQYGRSPKPIVFSASGKKGPSLAAMGHGRHYRGLGRLERDYVDNYLKLHACDPADLERHYKPRIKLNAIFFKYYEKCRITKMFTTRRSGLFQKTEGESKTSRGVFKSPEFSLILSLGTYLEYANILHGLKMKNQLVSFHRIENGPKFDLKRYVETGWFSRDTRPDTIIIDEEGYSK